MVIEGLIGVLAALFLMLFGVSGQAATPEPPQTTHSLVVIDGAQAQVLKSYPAQIVLQIDGHLPDGCDYPAQITQRREGNTVTLDVYREVPLGVMCPMIYKEYHGSVHLDGSFESGTYTLRVNGYEMQVTI